MAIDYMERARCEEAATARLRAAAEPSAHDDFGIEARARRQWETDPSLRAEFAGCFESWLAFAKAEAKALVRIISKKA